MRDLKRECGSYMPAFFYMKLEYSFHDSRLSLYNLSVKDRATFVHEYIHFLQDISTYFGLNNAYVYSEYIHGAVNLIYKEEKSSFDIPMNILDNYGNIELNQFINKSCTGDYEEINSLFIFDIEKKLKKVKFNNEYIKEIELIFLKVEKGKKIQFGARAIMESMAFLIEREISPGGNDAKEYPYYSAEFVVKYIYPKFAEDILNVIALCDLSLQFSNPAKIFVEVLEDFKDKQSVPQKAEDLYNYFYEKPCMRLGKESRLILSLMDFSITVLEQFKTYLFDKSFNSFHETVSNMIIGALDYRINHPTFILDIVRVGNTLYNVPLRNLLNRFGTPIIKDKNEDYHVISSNKCSNNDLQYFVAIEQIYKLLAEGADCCDMVPWCENSENIELDNRCINEPWERCTDNSLCPYAILWKHWNLSKYKPHIVKI